MRPLLRKPHDVQNVKTPTKLKKVDFQTLSLKNIDFRLNFWRKTKSGISRRVSFSLDGRILKAGASFSRTGNLWQN